MDVQIDGRQAQADAAVVHILLEDCEVRQSEHAELRFELVFGKSVGWDRMQEADVLENGLVRLGFLRAARPCRLPRLTWRYRCTQGDVGVTPHGPRGDGRCGFRR